MGVVVVRGDEHGNVICLCNLEELLDVLDRVVLGDALAHHAPGDAVGAQEIVLRIGDHERRAPGLDLHAGIGELRRGGQGTADDGQSRQSLRYDLHVGSSILVSGQRVCLDWRQR